MFVFQYNGIPADTGYGPAKLKEGDIISPAAIYTSDSHLPEIIRLAGRYRNKAIVLDSLAMFAYDERNAIFII